MRNSFFERIRLIPLAIVNVLALLILLLLLWVTYSFYLTDIQLIEREKSMLKVEQAQGKILFYDEVLTMSARMAVATGDISWEQRYRDAEAKLDKNINKAKILFPSIFKTHLEQTKDANEKLIEFENKAFELIALGETEKAKELLFSDEYELNKQQYSQAAASVHKKLDQLIKEEEEKTESAQIRYLFVFIVIVLVFIFAWIYLNIVLLRGRVELNKKEFVLRGILENAVDGIISIDKQGTILSVNPATERLFGYSSEEMVGENVKMLMPSPYHEEHDGYLSNYHATGKKKIIGIGREVIGQRKDGSTFPMELSVSENKVGDAHSFTGIVRDVSERKETEHEILEKNKQLTRSNEELERFAYVASHDLQEPLRMVSSYTQLLAKRYQGKLDEDADDYINFAVDGAVRMQSLIQDLLKYSRLNTEAHVFKSVDANALFDYAVQNLAVTIDETGTVVMKDDLPMVSGDEGKLRQLFQNLIGNAVKYRDPDKLNKVHITVEDANGVWQFCVADNGIGFAPEYYEKIFVIFKRLHTASEYQGTGIGLSLCKRIVESHNGRIWVESEAGQGSRFYFTLMKDEE